MLYEWGISEKYDDRSSTHASDDFERALCNRNIKLHRFTGRYEGDNFPPLACKKCVKLFTKMTKMNCIEVRKERIRLGEI